MNTSKLIFLTILALSPHSLKPKDQDDESQFERFIEKISKNFKKGFRSLADWLEYYRDSSTDNLTDWIDYCRTIAPTEIEALQHFIVDEKDVAFNKLSLEKQQAFKDLNRFYYKMSIASKEKQKELIQNFSTRWKEIQKTLRQ